MGYSTLEEHAKENSSYTVPVAFTDEEDVAMTPDTSTIVWSLTNLAGSTINSRSAVAITEDTSINITLSGDDLEVSDDADTERIIYVSCTYTSSYGANLPFKDEIHFIIDPLLNT